MLKIFHTGDIHIGKKFKNYESGVRDALVEARFECIESMVDIANSEKCNIFAVAGDLFDRVNNVPKKDIKRVADLLCGFKGSVVVVLPGNHDFYDEDSVLWHSFEDSVTSSNVVLLKKNEPVLLDEFGLDAVIYPAICESRHSDENALGWMKQSDFSFDVPVIGMAHGALEALSADLEGKYYFMTMDELHSIPVDAWLLGHTHVPYPQGDTFSGNRIFNAGTPEPDGMDFHGEGAAFIITVDENSCSAKRVITSKYRFADLEYDVKSFNDLEKIADEICSMNKDGTYLIRLRLNGTLDRDDYVKLPDLYKKIGENVFYLDVRDKELTELIDKSTVESEFTRGSFPYRFLMELADDKDALQMAYELVKGDI